MATNRARLHRAIQKEQAKRMRATASRRSFIDPPGNPFYQPGGGTFNPNQPVTGYGGIPLPPGYAPLKPGPALPPPTTGPGVGGGFDPCGLLPGILGDLCREYGPDVVDRITGKNGGNGQTSCPSGQIKVGTKCVDPTAVLPGGDPFISPAGGTTTMGAFGMPAVRPVVKNRPTRDCPDGMVLGRDNLCYPKQVLPRRSKYRKWKGERRPKISAKEWKTLKKAERVKDEAREVAKTAGWKVTKK